MTAKLNDPEPAPIKNQFPAVWDLVYADIIERDKKGEEKYGTRLQAFNGRKTLVDAYQEALDLVVYLRQAIFEQDYNKSVKENSYIFPKQLINTDSIEIPNDRKLSPVIVDSGSFDEKVLWSPEKDYQIPDEAFCSCPGAVEIYLAADDAFRCRTCEKRIQRACKS